MGQNLNLVTLSCVALVQLRGLIVKNQSYATKCDQIYNNILLIWSHLKLQLGLEFCSTNRQFVEDRGGFIEHLSLTYVAQLSETQIIPVAIMNLVTPKAGAKNELLFNKLASGFGFKQNKN